jgi:hypothetical protein
LAGVRDEAGLRSLPESERRDWQEFWNEVSRRLKAIRPAS